MVDRRVLADTSVWIQLDLGRAPTTLARHVSLLVEAGRLVTAGPIKLEVLQGARSEAAYRRIRRELDALPEIPVTGDLWERAAFLGHRLARRGLTVIGMDLLIAALAIAHDCALLHLDKDFDRIRQVAPLVMDVPGGAIDTP